MDERNEIFGVASIQLPKITESSRLIRREFGLSFQHM
jgi:hypothetical protein